MIFSRLEELYLAYPPLGPATVDEAAGRLKLAHAAFADGWSVRWTGPASVTIEAGPLSWFDMVRADRRPISISVHLARPSPAEATCIGQSFANVIDGVVCFDALLAKSPKAQ